MYMRTSPMRLVVELPEESHRRLRIRAAQDGLPVAVIIRRLITDYLGAGVTLVETSFVKDPPTPAMTVRQAVAAPSLPVDAVSKTPVGRSTVKRPLPDFSKAAQAKGKMGR